jgi:TonB family protein
MAKSGADKAANAGNPYAKQDTVATAAGTGGGLNPIGNEALDEGLQGRGLVGALPQPIYPAGNKGGKVVVRVAVNQSGVVTEAAYEPKGSTTSDKALVDAALAAARKARFTESKAFVQGGRITYLFRMK